MPETSKAIVVLGMHRTGTSLTMAAVEALGVDTGDHLLPPGSDNETGYWEDSAVIDLNERLLAALGKTWYSLAPITKAEWLGPEVSDLKREAVALLRHRFPQSDIWGFKDPRCLRLWPFWRQVLSDMAVPVKYVVTFRHPDSVAASLAYRNQFAPARSYFLWLTHYVPALEQLLAESSIFIDYDQLIDQPTEVVERLAAFIHGAGWLNRQSKPGPVDAFLERTLQRRLRHARFEAGEMATEVPALLRDTHALLGRLAKGGADGGAGHEVATLQQHYQSYAMLLGQMDASQFEADRLEKIVREEESVRDKIEKIGLYHADTNKKMEGIDARHVAESQRLDVAIGRWDACLGELQLQHGALSSVQDGVAALAEKATLQQGTLSAIQDVTHVLAGRVEDVQEKVVVQLDEFYRVLKKELGHEEASRNSELARQLAEARAEVESLYRSTSWRITRPVRAVRNFMLRMSRR